MRDDVLSVNQQRARRVAGKMAAIGLESQLRLLVGEIISGDASKIHEFYYWLRFAPPEMNVSLLDFLDARESQ